jgi:hypothetical protein
MNSLLIAYAVLLLIRFTCLKEGDRFTFKRLLAAAGLLLLTLPICFQSIPFTVVMFLPLILLHGILYIAERRLERTSPALRAVTLIIGLALVWAVLISGLDFSLRWRSLSNFSAEWLALLVAALLCLKESNFVIRWFFRYYKLVKKVEALTDAPSTENGRIIGNLERLLLLLFLWEGAALAATFIVAVKGLARFKKMEEHQAFAEYVIIGTFLSVLLTILIYKTTRWMY